MFNEKALGDIKQNFSVFLHYFPLSDHRMTNFKETAPFFGNLFVQWRAIWEIFPFIARTVAPLC